MRIFDGHVHLFSPKIIENVSRRKELVALLSLDAAEASGRSGIEPLARGMARADVTAALMLPTAAAADVSRVNAHCLEQAAAHGFLHTAGTLHPDSPDNDAEMERLARHGVRGIKLCSFSQGFVLDGPPALKMFDRIQRRHASTGHAFFVILDTFYHADRHFGTDPAFTTTPEKLGALARRYPQIVFIGAHMGGLTAPFDAICRHLPGCPNLCLDTSNAAHTLSAEQFVHLLRVFGPDRILFGTDWPWFDPRTERTVIEQLADAAGFDSAAKAALFYGNMAALLGC